MKQFVLALLFGAVAVSARPRYLVIPMEDVEFVEAPAHHIVRRDVVEQDQPLAPSQLRMMAAARARDRDMEEEADRRQDLGGPQDLGAGSFFNDRVNAKIPSVPDSIGSASTSGYHADHHKSADYVDYGAYTGGYGAFGWYTDHPVLVYYH